MSVVMRVPTVILILLSLQRCCTAQESIYCSYFSFNYPMAVCQGSSAPKSIRLKSEVDTYHFENAIGFSVKNIPEARKKGLVGVNAHEIGLSDLNFTNFLDLEYLFLKRITTKSSKVNLPTNLKELRITNSSLTGLVIEPSNHNLSSLDLSHNELRTVPYMVQLKELILADNKISTLKTSACTPMHQLSTLDLRKNKLTDLEKDAFLCIFKKNSKKPLQLYLSQNKISRIHEKAFDGLEINEIDLSANQIKTLSYDALEWMDIRSINLQDNPLVCNKSLQWMINGFVQQLNLTTPHLLDDLSCGYPDYLRDVHLANWLNPLATDLPICNCTDTDGDDEEGSMWNATTISVVVVLIVAVILSFIFPRAAESIWSAASDLVSYLLDSGGD